jgi:hypothetical protein
MEMIVYRMMMKISLNLTRIYTNFQLLDKLRKCIYLIKSCCKIKILIILMKLML